jgi:hypothetical protein
MDNLERLIQKAVDNQCRLQIRFDPEEKGEQWGIKFYPELDDDGHFYAYHEYLQTAARKLLDELAKSNKW